MAKEKLERVKRLVAAGEYEQARRIVSTINHPNQAKWLDAIDDREFGDPFKAAQEEQTSAPQRRHRLRTMLLILLVLLAPVAIYFLYTSNQEAQRLDVASRLSAYCRDVYYDLEMYESRTACFDWAYNAPDSRFEIAEECDRRAGALDSEFAACLIGEEVVPPGVVVR